MKGEEKSIQYFSDYFICVATLLFRILITVFCTVLCSKRTRTGRLLM